MVYVEKKNHRVSVIECHRNTKTLKAMLTLTLTSSKVGWYYHPHSLGQGAESLKFQ